MPAHIVRPRMLGHPARKWQRSAQNRPGAQRKVPPALCSHFGCSACGWLRQPPLERPPGSPSGLVRSPRLFLSLRCFLRPPASQVSVSAGILVERELRLGRHRARKADRARSSAWVLLSPVPPKVAAMTILRHLTFLYSTTIAWLFCSPRFPGYLVVLCVVVYPSSIPTPHSPPHKCSSSSNPSIHTPSQNIIQTLVFYNSSSMGITRKRNLSEAMNCAMCLGCVHQSV